MKTQFNNNNKKYTNSFKFSLVQFLLFAKYNLKSEAFGFEDFNNNNNKNFTKINNKNYVLVIT